MGKEVGVGRKLVEVNAPLPRRDPIGFPKLLLTRNKNRESAMEITVRAWALIAFSNQKRFASAHAGLHQ